MAKAEKLLIENKLLKDFLKDDFTSKLDKVGKIFPISIVFINEIERDGKRISNPIIISHQNNEEVNKLKGKKVLANQEDLVKFWDNKEDEEWDNV